MSSQYDHLAERGGEDEYERWCAEQSDEQEDDERTGHLLKEGVYA